MNENTKRYRPDEYPDVIYCPDCKGEISKNPSVCDWLREVTVVIPLRGATAYWHKSCWERRRKGGFNLIADLRQTGSEAAQHVE